MAQRQKAAEWVGRVIADRYRITGVIGAGGMGHVFAAEQSTLNREVAIKVIRRHLADNEEAVSRFIREAQIVAKLDHPNIVTAHDFGRLPDNDGLYIVMEKLNGQTVAEAMGTQPVQWQNTLRIVREVASALATAHGSGVIHRDLKPDNIMITTSPTDGETRIKVLDFGVAKLTEQPGDTHLTGSGILLGTPGYMAPELIMHGVTNDARSDLYALGIIWLELLLGRRVYQGNTATALLVAQVNEPVPALSDVAPGLDVPLDIQALLYQCVKRGPELRPDSARTVVRQIDELAQRYGIGGVATPGAGTTGFSSVPSLASSAPPAALSSMGAPSQTLPLGSVAPTPTPPPAASSSGPPSQGMVSTQVGYHASATSPPGAMPLSTPYAAGVQTGPTPEGMVMPSGAYPPPGRSGLMVAGALVVGLLVAGAVIAAFLVGRTSADPLEGTASPAVVADGTIPAAAVAPTAPVAAAVVPASAATAGTEPAAAAPSADDAPVAAVAASPKKKQVAAAVPDRKRKSGNRSRKDSADEKARSATSRKRSSTRGRGRRASAATATENTSADATATASGAASESATSAPKGPATLSSALLTNAIRKNMGSAKACANTNITQHPKKQIGLMVDHCPSYQEISPNQTLSLSVDENGKVSGASFTSREANKSKIGRCVLASLKGWEFPEFDNGGKAATIKRPIRFQECGPINGKCVFQKPRY